MLAKLASLSSQHPRRSLWLGLLVLIVAGVLGGPAQNVLKARNDFEDPGSPAAHARALIQRATGIEDTPGIEAVVLAGRDSAEVTHVLAELRASPDVGVAGPLIPSRSGRATLIPVSLKAAVQPSDGVAAVTSLLAGDRRVLLGGGDVAQHQVGTQVSKDLGLAEAIVFPLLAILAMVFFRGLAALLPLGGGLLSILLSFVLLRVVNVFFTMSVFALNLVIGLGLGLAVDYSLFLVSRFREELAAGHGREAALVTTLDTAGRTAIFSALTVAAAMLSLLVFPLRFLQSMAAGGAIVALTAAAVALLLTPAAMYLMAPRLARHQPVAQGTGRWYGLARAIMRRPGVVAAGTAAVMLVVAVPSLSARWSGVNETVLPAGASAREAGALIARDFPLTDGTPVTVAVTATPSGTAAVQTLHDRIARLPGVAGTGNPEYLGSGVWRLAAYARGQDIQPTAQRVVSAIRALPTRMTLRVGGSAASFHDRQAAIGRLLPLALAILAVTTLVILWVMTGSVVLPLKALVMNGLTVGVATGVLVFVFQDGRLTGLLGYTSQGGIETTDFLVLATVAFALSTDYGVFLLNRIKEARRQGLDEREAVAVGLQRTGNVISAAAILLAVAIGAFAVSKIIFIKELGLGAFVAVLVDAFLVRSVLVPSLMALLGRWNWWSPAPLQRFHRRFETLTAEA